MKKRLIAAAVCVAVLILLGWGTRYLRVERYDLYFQEADLSAASGGDALRAEPLYIEAGEARDTRELAERLVAELLAGPEDPTLVSPIPTETTLLSLELDGARAKVDLSSRYRLLSGVALALADYAITLTLTQLPEISSVSITVRGQQLAYRDRQVFYARDVLFCQQRGRDRQRPRDAVLPGRGRRPDAPGGDAGPVRGRHPGGGPW